MPGVMAHTHNSTKEEGAGGFPEFQNSLSYIQSAFSNLGVCVYTRAQIEAGARGFLDS